MIEAVRIFVKFYKFTRCLNPKDKFLQSYFICSLKCAHHESTLASTYVTSNMNEHSNTKNLSAFARADTNTVGPSLLSSDLKYGHIHVNFQMLGTVCISSIRLYSVFKNKADHYISTRAVTTKWHGPEKENFKIQDRIKELTYWPLRHCHSD
jgi:hypothetical protein